MIPETNGTLAYFKSRITLPVIAWDDDGDALVASSKGYLTKARLMDDFLEVDTLTDESAPTALIPGGGWVADYGNGCTAPVVAWGVGRDGRLRAFAAFDYGLEAEASGSAVEFTVRHPDETAPSEQAAAS